MGLLIENVLLFTNTSDTEIFPNQSVVIENGLIQETGSTVNLSHKYAGFEKLDGQGKLLMPGWINPHMHLYGTFARGVALKKVPYGFKQILEQLWWNLDKALDAESVYYSALIPAITAIKSGVTSIIDHHASPNTIDGSLDRIQEALELIGLSGILCYEISDRDGPEKAQAGLAENERYIEKVKKSVSSYQGMIGLHAAFTLSDDTLTAAADLGRRLDKGFHIHLAEGKEDDARPQYGISTTQRLHNFGILGRQTIAAHAIHISDADKELLKSTETMVVHNPQSNMNNAVGRADIFALLDAGILTGLGTDGMSVSLFGDMRAANLIHKHDLKDNCVGWQEVQKMVLQNNRQIYARVSGIEMGQIKPGAQADVILVDYFPPTPLTNENIWGHILFGIADAIVDTTVINGKIVMRNKQLLTIDEQETTAKSREFAHKVWGKM